VILKNGNSVYAFFGSSNGSAIVSPILAANVGFPVLVTSKTSPAANQLGPDQVRVGAVDIQAFDAYIYIESAKDVLTSSSGDDVIIDTTADIIGKIVVKYDALNGASYPLTIDGYDYAPIVAGSNAIPGAKVIGNGSVEYGVFPTTIADPLGNTISAAWYVINETSPAATTYYYTTLANAIGKSDEIHIVGDLVILEDVTLGVADKNTKIWIDAGASLTVGDKTHSPIVTVPANTDIYNNSGRADGYDVANGQIVFDKTKAEAATFAAPTSDVKIIKGDKIIYTDVGTALSLASSGDVIDILRDAWIDKDVTIPAGVELKDNAYSLSISKGASLTVNGTYTSTGAVVNGTPVATAKEKGIIGNVLVKNGGKVTFNGGSYQFTGTIEIDAGGSVSIGNAVNTTIDGNAAYKYGTINSAGTLVLGSDTRNAHVYIDKLTLTGSASAKINTGSSIDVFKSAVIGNVPELLSNLTNTVTVDGIIAIGADAYLLVYGESTFTDANVFGTPLKTVFQVGNTKYSGKTYATLYAANPTNVVIVLPNVVKLKDFSLVGWFEDSSLLIPYNPASGNLIGYLPTLYGNFIPKQYEVTLSYSEGTEWTVNGIGYGTSKLLLINYGDSIRVDAKALPGYTGTPTFTVNGSSYSANTSYTVTGDATFVVGGISTAEADTGSVDNSLTLIEILLIIIVIIIGIIMIVVAIKLLRS
jgi:hypothetical protein